MKAALCRAFGGPEVVRVEDIDDPSPGPGEAVIDVAACALNFFDTLVIREKYQHKPDLPFSPGAEVAGTVAATGEGVSSVAPGQRVIAYLRFNGAREKGLGRPDALVPIPEGVSDEVACGVTVTYGTAIHGLKDRGGLQAGENVAVLGAAGGAGLAAVQIARGMGARVIACASSADKLAVAREHGADEGINYAHEDLKARLRELTGGDGVDLVYDCVGGDYSETAFRALAWAGRFLVIGFAAGAIPKLPLNLPLLKSADVRGVFWGAWAERNPENNRANIEQILKWCASGELKPHIHGVYPLDDIVDALQIIDTRQATGKVVIRLR
jgi:NADPH2:quinone reductase